MTTLITRLGRHPRVQHNVHYIPALRASHRVNHFRARRFFASSPSPPLARVSLSLTQPGLAVKFAPDAQASVFPYTWLRDSDPQLIHPGMKQKLHATSDVPLDCTPLDVLLTRDDTHIKVIWNTERDSSKTEFPSESEYSLDLLRRHSDPQVESEFHRTVSAVPWTRADILRTPDLTISYASLLSPDGLGLYRAMTHISKYGLLFVTGVPNAETSNETCELVKLASLFSEIRETWYGRVWDVQSKGSSSRNIAYSSLELGLHMDLQYFENPPRYQLLHMLRNKGVKGGESVFSDALHAAKSLSRDAFDVLATHPVGFHYINDGHHMYREHTTIELAEGSKLDDRNVAYVNYSPPFQSPLPLRTARNPAFISSLVEFTDLLYSEDNRFEYQLDEGDAVIFDNRRVLHGRHQFENGSSEDGTGVMRWLKGCYIGGDTILDRRRVLGQRLGLRT